MAWLQRKAMTATAEVAGSPTGEIIGRKELAEALLEQAREQDVSLFQVPGGSSRD